MDHQTFDSFKEMNQKKSDSELAKLFLDKTLLDFQKSKLQKQIDHSLSNYDKKEFLRLTELFKHL
ncbi:IDEAL domain-containing protein [Mesobacillus foraminis]|uniref:IDEAL domain-containing protein n=1 Tax=Mesobacillus foraminis TaxID=279826 RepID=UPI00288AAC66|nr:IDEAL domain-containing protein [Mesobacillus foraminis]